MIKRILIAEDIDSINTGIITLLNEKFDVIIEHANTCDKAYLKIVRALQDQQPYDLLISDLSFKSEGFLQPDLINGEELIIAAKKVQPQLKTIVYTIEDKTSLLKRLKEVVKVNSIVLKAQKSLIELCSAINAIDANEDYFSHEVSQIIKNDSTTAIDEYDVTLLDLLSKGLTQQEISKNMKQQAIKPCSVSAIEKRIGDLKSTLKANNSIHPVAIAKDMCII